MKKNYLLVVLLTLAVTSFSQEAFMKGTKSLNLGVGVGNPYWGTGYSNTLGVNPTVSFEVGISDEFSVGGHLSYSGASYEYSGYKSKFTGILIGPRGSYHFATSEKLDPYVGATLGYVIVSVSDNMGSANAAASGLGFGGFLGVRYFTKSAFGFHAELGYTSFSFLTAGISLKLK